MPGHAFRHVVQAVGPRVERYFDRPWQAGEERLSRLVVIGFKGLDRAAIAAAIAAASRGLSDAPARDPARNDR